MSQRKSDLGIPCPRKICQSSVSLYRRDKSQIKLTDDQLSELLGGSCISGIHPSQVHSLKGSGEGVVIKTSDSFHIEIGVGGPVEPEIYVTDYGDSEILPINILKGYQGSAFVIESRIRTLRQLYATIFLVQNDQAEKIPPEAENSFLTLNRGSYPKISNFTLSRSVSDRYLYFSIV
jgi:hypothetical protein